MSDVVKVIYEGANRRGFATSPGEAIYFNPGMNEIPADQWKLLMADKDPGSVEHFLKNRMLVLAEESVQESDSMADMKVEGAIQMVENAMTAEQLNTLKIQENTRPKARASVMRAIATRQEMFDKVENAKKEDAAGGGEDDGGEDGGGDGDE